MCIRTIIKQMLVVKLDTRVNMYVGKSRLSLVLDLTKWTFKGNKEIKIEKNIKKISA